MFIIQNKCEGGEEEPVIITDVDELTFTKNTDFARIDITSNIDWYSAMFLE